MLFAFWIPKDMKNMYACLFSDLVKKYVSVTAILTKENTIWNVKKKV